jgi:hypothetical protein
MNLKDALDRVIIGIMTGDAEISSLDFTVDEKGFQIAGEFRSRPETPAPNASVLPPKPLPLQPLSAEATP